MASCQAKIAWKMPRKRKTKNYQSFPFLHDASQKIPKKIVKKIKKIKKNTLMASFQAKIGWERPRKRKYKNDRYAPFLHDA